MSVYFDYSVSTNGDNILCLRWHSTKSLLAIATQGKLGGEVSFFNEQGSAFSDISVSKSSSTPTALSWSPKRPLCAVGWSTGEISVWAEGEKPLPDSEQSGASSGKAGHLHRAEIVALEWTSLGSRLLSGDAAGLVHVWRVDAKGRVQSAPLYGHRPDSPITCALLLPTVQKDKDALDIAALAKAAVSGDERALDLLSWKKEKGVKFNTYGPEEATSFFIGCHDGTLLFMNDRGETSNLVTIEGSVVRMLFHEERSILMVASDTGLLTQFHAYPGGGVKELIKVKLACRTPKPCIQWAGDSVLAMALGEHLVRMWDILREDNYTLVMNEAMGYTASAKINTIAYSKSKHVLAAGTSLGQVAFWHFTSRDTGDPEDAWELAPPASLEGGSISLLHWGPDLLGVACGAQNQEANKAFTIRPHTLSAHYGKGAAVVQTGPYSAMVGLFSANIHQELKTQDKIRGVCTTNELLVLWDGASVTVHEYTADKDSLVKSLRSFNCASPFVLVHEQSIFTVEPQKIQVRNSQGTVKQLLYLSEMEGNVISMKLCGDFLVCATDKACIKLFDLSRREAKPVGQAKFLSDAIPGSTAILSVACNSNGSFVSVVVERGEAPGTAPIPRSVHDPDSHLYVWDVELDSFQFFNFATGLSEQDEYGQAPLKHLHKQEVVPPVAPRKHPVAGRRASSGMHKGNRGRGDIDVHKSESPDLTDEVKTTVGMTPEEGCRNETAGEVAGRYPVRHMWDAIEPRLLVVEAKRTGQGPSKEQKQKRQNELRLSSSFSVAKAQMEEAETMIVSLFATQETGLLMQDHFPMHPDHSQLLGVDVPYFYFVVRPDVANRPVLPEEKPTDVSLDGLPLNGPQLSSSTPISNIANNRHVARRTMRDFIGLEEADKGCKEAMLNFSYYLTIGNMDEAFKAMKVIKSESVWGNLSRMCVTTRRLDVAAMCMGKMGFARGAMMVRQSREKDMELDAQAAMLALQLGMTEEAERLLKRCKRFDLLNRLYQSMGQWAEAVETAEGYDRIHLRSTYYNYAKYLESQGDIGGAISNYTKSETFRFEVPRMLFDTPEELEKFIQERPDKSLQKWWAQYMESVGEMKMALEFYKAAGDYLALVRVHCFLGEEGKAAEICNDTGDRAACYHLARQFETSGNVDDALHFFSRAQAYSSAIRLCKEQGRDDHLVNLALLGKPEDMVEAATYLETKTGYEERAVMLFHKAGQVSRAVDLAFRTRQFGALQHISRDLTDRTDPALLQKCADFFMNNNQFDRAVDLLANGKQNWEAVKLCIEYNVPITEELAEKLTPSKPGSGSAGGSSDDHERIRLLEAIAEVCLNQRQYHVACKKYTQAGNRVMAMKALLKSGDTEKVIFFATVSKQRDIYVMAANYLQSVDWRREPEVMKHIIQFYTRGKALESLASFYEACAQVEIDEYQNYEKAVGAYGESYKCYAKATMQNETLKEQRMNVIKDKVVTIRKFITAKSLFGENSDEALRQCQALLEEPGIDETVRLGDIYAAMIDHFVKKDMFKAAYACLEEMRRKLHRSSNISFFVNQEVVEQIHRAMGVAPPRGATNGSRNGVSGSKLRDDDEVDEDVAEALDDDY